MDSTEHNEATTVIPDPIVSGSPPASAPPPAVAPAPTPPAPPQGHQPTPALSDALVQQVLGEMSSINTVLAPYVSLVSPEDKQHTVRSRPGVEQQIPLLVQLAQQNKISLGDYSLDQFEADVQLVNQLTAINAPILRASTTIADTILVTKGRYFSALSAIYSALSSLATHDLGLALDLEPVAQLFAVKKPVKHKTSNTESSGTTSAGAPAASASGTATPATSALTTYPNERRKKPRELTEVRRAEHHA